jgi:CRISPR-associated protein Cas6/Cse3/CasE subtype I-E
MFLSKLPDHLDLDDYAVHRRLMDVTGGKRCLFQRKGFEIDVLTEVPLPSSTDVSSIIEGLKKGRSTLFTARLNPVVTKFIEGKSRRVGVKGKDAVAWVEKMLAKHGIEGVFDVRGEGPRLSQRQGATVTHSSVLVSGILTVKDSKLVASAVKNGIGHAKGFGFGMINVFAC